MSRRSCFAAIVVVAGLGAALRLPALNLRPMHGDEAVHTIKFDILWQQGEYRYDIQDYHGPTLYYLALPVVWLCGDHHLSETSKATFRIVPAVCGIGLILLLLLCTESLGRAASVCAAILAAVSPALVYYSRYYIQETLLVMFTFGAVISMWRYTRARRWRWVLAAGVCVGLMHATKETAVIAYGVMVLALIGTWLWNRAWPIQVSNGPSADVAAERAHVTATPDVDIRLELPRQPTTSVAAAACLVAVAAAVSVACYSVFFTNIENVLDLLRVISAYWGRGTLGGPHQHPWYYYLKMLSWSHWAPGPVWSEALIIVLAATGVVTSILGRIGTRAVAGHVRFLVLFTLLMTTIYSMIPYKTPWCMLQFLYPMILMAGVGVAALFRAIRSRAVRSVLAVVLSVGAVHLARQAYAASFRLDCDPRNPYAYAHPVRDIERLGEWLNKLAAIHPDGPAMAIGVIGEDCWPLPWYLRCFPHVYYSQAVPPDPDAAVLISDSRLQSQLESRLQDRYRISYYGLRPGSVFAVHVSEQLWQAFRDSASPPRQERGDPHAGRP